MRPDCPSIALFFMFCSQLVDDSLLTEAFIFFSFFFFLTGIISHVFLLQKLNFMKIVAIIPQSIWTLLGL